RSRLDRERRERPAAGDDDGGLPAHQLGRQPGEVVGLVVGPAVVELHVLALGKSGFLEALAKRGKAARLAIRRPGVEKADRRPPGPAAAGGPEKPTPAGAGGARTAAGQATAAPPSRAMNSRRLMAPSGWDRSRLANTSTQQRASA